MDSWFNKGRPALLEAFTTICQQIDRDLIKELQQSPSNGAAINQEAGPNGSRHALMTQCSEHQDTASVLGAEQSTDTAEGAARDSHDEDSKRWQLEYTRLNQKYNALAENFKKAKEALHKRRHERDQWIQHAKLLERRLQEAEIEHGIYIIGENSEQPENPHEQNGDDEQRLARGSVSAPNSSGLPDCLHTNAASISARRSDARHIVSRTASESPARSEEPVLPILPIQNNAPVKIKEEPSSDGAIFVEERSLRKRKLGDDAEDASDHRRLKLEPSDHSSSPLIAMQDINFKASDSIDLGEQSPAILTPRRHQERGLLVSDEDRPIGAGAVAPRSVRGSSPIVSDVTTTLSHGYTSALTPISLNVRRPQEHTPVHPLGQSLRKGLNRGIAVLAEDGAVDGQPAQGSPSARKAKNPVAKSRLDSLLNTHYVEDQRKVDRPSPRGRQIPTNTRGGLAMPKPRDLPFDRNGRPDYERPDASVSTVPRPPLADATNTAHNKVQSTSNRKKTRSSLRNKPISELKLEDFKINPTLNDGHDFAFSEVVRNKDDRACLTGCVDMHCCGKEFRALALSQRPNPPLTPDQRQEEQRLLEEYLGDYCYRLAMMSKEERAEVWVEAKMRELANKYGTHRHRFSRMRSPPGFWNPDFPSTQELETNRAEAEKRERQTVRDRYREAMRSNGRWLFRDE